MRQESWFRRNTSWTDYKSWSEMLAFVILEVEEFQIRGSAFSQVLEVAEVSLDMRHYGRNQAFLRSHFFFFKECLSPFRLL